MRRPFPPARTAWTALACLLGAFAVTPVTAAAAPAAAAAVPAAAAVAADEVVERPSDGVLAVEGHGWGHGRGMSQWGAQGAASLGQSAESIVGAYYPGTSRTVLAPAPIRVLLQGDEGRDTVVHPGDGLRVTDLATGTSQELPQGPDRWRVVPDATGLQVQSRTGTTWAPYAVGSATSLVGPVRFSGPTFVRLAFANGSSRDYRGAVQAVRTGSTSLRSVVVLDLEDYLLGVVPRESSSSWRPAALQAQAIAARSYSANKRERVGGNGTYDICDTTQCQVFGGSRLHTASGAVTELEPATTSQAVRDTAGVVRSHEGRSIFSEFSSSNGGWSTKGHVPYLVARRDDWDGALSNPVHSWKAALRATDLERRFPAVGTLERIRITGRDGNGAWGGRVKLVVLEGRSSTGAATRVTTTGAGVYNARTWPASSDGLRSSWFRFAAVSAGSRTTAQSTAPTLVREPGVPTGRLTATLENTGPSAWAVAGLHLSHGGQADPLAGGSTRPGALVATSRPGASTVEPGERAEFAVDLDATAVAPGTHLRAYRLRVGDGTPFGTPVRWSVRVQAPVLTASYAATPAGAPGAGGAPSRVSADGRTVVVPRNGSTTVRLSLRNTGNVAWRGGPDGPVLLGTSGPRNRTSASAGPGWVSPQRAARLLADTAPGATGALDLVLHGRGRGVGVTRESFEPLWSGRGWITGAARTFDVVRVDSTVSRLAAVHTAPATTVTLRSGGAATLVVRLRNLGGSPWTVGAERLGTSGDRASPFATPAWASPSRPPALAANTVRPGAAKVYPGEVGEWRIPLRGRVSGTSSLVLQAVGPTRRYGPVMTSRVTVSAAGSALREASASPGPTVTAP